MEGGQGILPILLWLVRSIIGSLTYYIYNNDYCHHKGWVVFIFAHQEYNPPLSGVGEGGGVKGSSKQLHSDWWQRFNLNF
jgi:hypothetical protein